ncbi:MAG: hypothetical protein ACR2JB_23780 [Bryobacteraceae bacterium]
MNKRVEFKAHLTNRAYNSFGVLWNSSRRGRKAAVTAVALTTAAISVLAAALIFPSASRADDGDEVKTFDGRECTTFTVDVTQHLASNVQNDVDPSEGQALFRRGDTFIVDGSIYPAGSIPSGIAEPHANAPIIGKYRIRGTFTADTAAFNQGIAGDASAPQIVAFATESFSLPDDETTILTDGIWPNARKSAHRVVLGGTGRFRDVVGEIYEDNIGENHDGFCNSRVTFKIRKAAFRHER